MARPRKPVDLEQLKIAASQQWDDEMIGALFHVSGQTVRRRFGAAIDECRQSGKSKLVATLWARAVGNKATGVTGSDRVLIHIADRFLGPVKQEVAQQHQGKIEVVITDYRSKKE
jgi:hypothetical protein